MNEFIAASSLKRTRRYPWTPLWRLCRHQTKGVTKDRILKAQGLAKRSGIEWADVLAAMTDEQRAQVDGA